MRFLSSILPFALFLVRGVALAADGSAASYDFPAPPVATSAAPLRAVPTYNNIGLYFKPTEGATDRTALVRYRVLGTRNWSQGHDMWFDDRDLSSRGQPERSREYRSSIVQVRDGTTYEIEVFLSGVNHVARSSVTTWSNRHKIAREVLVKSSDQTLLINQGGSAAEGYVLYRAAEPGVTIDVANARPHNVRIEASFVILQGLVLKGAQTTAVLLARDVTDVVVDGNDISGWGRAREDGWGKDWDDGIATENATSNRTTRITIQNNTIHHPRHDSNTWKEHRPVAQGFHPDGPRPMSFKNMLGQIVVRHNRAYSDDDHYFNDGIGGGPNFSFTSGNLGPDSDVHDNSFSHCWDDAIEVEGMNQNVRVYRNFTDRSLTGVAISATTIGPIYIFRNVSHRFQQTPADSWFDRGGCWLKSQSRIRTGMLGGRVYVYHNTLVKNAAGGGVAKALDGLGDPLSNIVSRNNVFTGRLAIMDYGEWDGKTDPDYDLHAGGIRSPSADRYEQNGIKAEIAFDFSYPLRETPLARNSPGHDRALRLPNFNDDYRGAGPDMGANERPD